MENVCFAIVIVEGNRNGGKNHAATSHTAINARAEINGSFLRRIRTTPG
jgi:hypothetical protein